jgi:hypothetical protein
MKAEFKGTSGPDGGNWSNPAAWVGGSVPNSSNRLRVQIDTHSNEDLGTAQAPFLTNDIIGAAIGISPPTLDVAGFLHAREVKNLLQLTSDSGSLSARDIKNVQFVSMIGTHTSMQIKHDIVNVQQFTATEESVVHVDGDLVKVQQAGISFGATLEVGRDLGATKLTIGGLGGTLILDHPEHHRLTNAITLDGGNDRIELGRLRFDKADFLPNSPGSSSGRIQLTEHGRSVYEMTNVTLGAGPTSTFSVGFDKATGYHFVAFSGP